MLREIGRNNESRYDDVNDEDGRRRTWGKRYKQKERGRFVIQGVGGCMSGILWILSYQDTTIISEKAHFHFHGWEGIVPHQVAQQCCSYKDSFTPFSRGRLIKSSSFLHTVKSR